jgi:nicotinamide-nucleotide amidase
VTGAPDPAYAAPHPTAAQVVRLLTERQETVAVAESLTGGLVVAALVSVPGASAVVRGGVVAYMTDLKATLLDVDQELLAREGAVHPDVAAAMARGAAARLGATYGLATTGVAGPDPQDGRPVGEVWMAVDGPGLAWERSETVVGEVLDAALGRAGIRAATVDAALDLLLDVVGGG